MAPKGFSACPSLAAAEVEVEAAVGEGWKRSKNVRKPRTTQKSAGAEAPVRDNEGTLRKLTAAMNLHIMLSPWGRVEKQSAIYQRVQQAKLVSSNGCNSTAPACINPAHLFDNAYQKGVRGDAQPASMVEAVWMKSP